jgi:hypothetical protein
LKRRTLKILAVSYAIKTLIVAVAWVLVPELPEIVSAKAREAWIAMVGPSSD